MITEEELYTMINLRGRYTGLPMNIWIGPRGHARHAPRIKVQMDHRDQFDLGKLAVVGIGTDRPQIIEGDLSASDLGLVRRYIALNRQVILNHWRGETDGVELVQALKPLTDDSDV
jgi:hypothetical protein